MYAIGSIVGITYSLPFLLGAALLFNEWVAFVFGASLLVGSLGYLSGRIGHGVSIWMDRR